MFKTEKAAIAIHTNLGAIFVSLELSRSIWLITSLSPGNGERMSKHSLRAGDVAGLFGLLSKMRERCRAKTRNDYAIVTIQEAGLDGFWIHRVLEKEGIESHVVDAASIATSRRHRRVKTDRIDGEALLRVLMAYKRGEPRVCSMARAPSPRLPQILQPPGGAGQRRQDATLGPREERSPVAWRVPRTLSGEFACGCRGHPQLDGDVRLARRHL